MCRREGGTGGRKRGREPGAAPSSEISRNTAGKGKKERGRESRRQRNRALGITRFPMMWQKKRGKRGSLERLRPQKKVTSAPVLFHASSNPRKEKRGRKERKKKKKRRGGDRYYLQLFSTFWPREWEEKKKKKKGGSKSVSWSSRLDRQLVQQEREKEREPREGCGSEDHRIAGDGEKTEREERGRLPSFRSTREKENSRSPTSSAVQKKEKKKKKKEEREEGGREGKGTGAGNFASIFALAQGKRGEKGGGEATFWCCGSHSPSPGKEKGGKGLLLRVDKPWILLRREMKD